LAVKVFITASSGTVDEPVNNRAHRPPQHANLLNRTRARHDDPSQQTGTEIPRDCCWKKLVRAERLTQATQLIQRTPGKTSANLALRYRRLQMRSRIPCEYPCENVIRLAEPRKA
jgi:hypothetical protein